MCGLDNKYGGLCPWMAMNKGNSSNSSYNAQPSQPGLDSTLGGPSPSSSYQSPLQQQLGPQNYSGNANTNSNYAISGQGPQDSYSGGGQAPQTYAGQTSSVSSSYMPDGDKTGNASVSLAGFQTPQQTYAPKTESTSPVSPPPEPKPPRRPDDEDEGEDPEHYD